MKNTVLELEADSVICCKKQIIYAEKSHMYYAGVLNNKFILFEENKNMRIVLVWPKFILMEIKSNEFVESAVESIIHF